MQMVMENPAVFEQANALGMACHLGRMGDYNDSNATGI
jgi:hypothetical protein